MRTLFQGRTLASVVFVSTIFLGTAACGGSAESASAEDDLGSESWTKVLECEGGSVVVDVDASERRHLQLVVRDPATFAALDAMPYGEITNASERIYRGDSPYGIFAPGDFRHLRRYELMRDASGQVPGVEVRRDGNDLRLRALDLARPGCEPTSLHTSPPDDVYPDACEARSYVFHGCQESP